MSAPLRQDLLLRAGGAMLLLTGAWCLFHVLHDPAALHGHAGWVDALAATYGFLGCSAGAVLALLGQHIGDPVAVSGRWAPVATDRERY